MKCKANWFRNNEDSKDAKPRDTTNHIQKEYVKEHEDALNVSRQR